MLTNCPKFDNIERYEMFTYYRDSPEFREQTKSEMDQIINLISSFDSAVLYTFDMNDHKCSEFDINPSERIASTVYRLFRYIPCTDVLYRIIHKNYAVYVSITKPTLNTFGTSSTLSIIVIDNNNDFPSMVVHRFAVNKSSAVSNKIELLPSSGSPYKSSLTNVDEYYDHDSISYDYLINLVAESIDEYIRDFKASRMYNHIDYQKSSIENAFIEKAFKVLMNHGNILSMNIDSFVRQYSSKTKSSNVERFTYSRVISGYDKEKYGWNGYNRSYIIKFSDHYSDFISEYVNSLNIFNPLARTNIIPYLMYPYYGSEISFQLSNKKFIYTNYEIIGNSVYIYAEYIINENMFISANATISNATTFNIDKSISEMKLNLNHIGDIGNIDVTISDVVDNIPDELVSTDNLLRLIKDMIIVQIAIHDRPEEHDVVYKKRTQRIGSITKEKWDKAERPVIVCKLAVPYKVARKSIKRNRSTRIGETRDPYDFRAQYWNRKGYYRHYANGTVTWVKPCICTRRKPTTKKEVHIVD